MIQDPPHSVGEGITRRRQLSKFHIIFRCMDWISSATPKSGKYQCLQLYSPPQISITIHWTLVLKLYLKDVKKAFESIKLESLIRVSDCFQVPQFSLVDTIIDSYTLQFSTGNFSDLEVNFLFKRDLMYFILQRYMMLLRYFHRKTEQFTKLVFLIFF